MRRKISQSIQIKTFLSMLALLAVCCIIIYGMVMIFLPRNYRTELEGQITSDFYEENLDTSAPSISCSATFQQGGQTYHLFANAALVAVAQSYDLLLKLIPFIAVVILLISVIGAVVCSRYYSKPLVSISNVAKRMTTLDMTWKCEVNRKDEIGVLAASLNEMSQRLNDAMDSLKAANWKLQKDIERQREQEKQRVEFFTAVSHELKTPIAIIKGQLEGMIYQVGEYKDRDTYLRRCMKTTNDMEALVKEILSAARMGGGDFHLERTDLDISQMLRKVCQQFRGRMEDKQIELRMDIQPEYHYQGDRRLMEKVFTNVIGNAVAYSPVGAVITVTQKDEVVSVDSIINLTTIGIVEVARMKMKNPMLVVTDIDKSVEFYKKVLGLHVIMDFGANKTLTGGLALQTVETYQNFIGKSDISFGGNNFEIYFEEDNFGEFADKLKECEVEYVHPIVEHSWGQRVVRFYDPDKHIIEVGENMKIVCKRFLNSGMTPEQVAERMDVPMKFVNACMR